MKTLILYGSQYGTTKRYADELSRLTGLPAVSYEKAPDLAGCEPIVYLGGLYAGGVKGLKQAVKKFPAGVRLILVTVGLADVQDKQNIENIRRSVRRQLPAGLEGSVELVDAQEALQADVIVILVGHDAFGKTMPTPRDGQIIIDCVNLHQN